MSSTNLNQSYELSLTSTIIVNAVVAVVVLLLYPLLRFLLPSIYSPNIHLPRRHTGLFGEICWFVDVFMQPYQVFSQRGNMTLIFVVFYNLLLSVYVCIALIALTILIPTYLKGTDQAFNASYLTFWSRMQLSHIEQGSSQVLIPILCCVFFTVLIMFFYQEFCMVYVYFRQKAFKRNIPQNYVVMLSNIPQDVNDVSELEKALSPIRHGISQIIPIPYKSRTITKRSEALRKSAAKIQRQIINLYTTSNQIITLRILHRLVGEKTTEKRVIDATRRLRKQRTQLMQTIALFKELKQKISITLTQERIGSNYFDKHSTYPPALPLPTEQQMTYIAEQRSEDVDVEYIEQLRLEESLGEAAQYDAKRQNEDLVVEYVVDSILTSEQKDEINHLYLKPYTHPEQNQIYYQRQSIGSYAFLICESQKTAAEKYTTLVAADYKHPEATIAPSPADIQWANLTITPRSRSVRAVVFSVVLAALFVFYFFIQAIIMGYLTRESGQWTLGIFKTVCGPRCYDVYNDYIDIVEEGACGFCYKLSNTIVTFIPTMVNSLLMSCLPFFIDFCIDILGLVSKSKACQYSYNILFIFLILIQGIIQVALPSAIQPETGTLDLKLLFAQSINGIISSLGSNLPNQTFVFINYIIAKYFLFPIIGLLNIPNLIFGLFFYLFDSNQFDRAHDLQYSPIFKYYKQMAYITHMFVVYFIFAIVAPFTNVVVLFTYLMMIITDRYYVLYIAAPQPSNELTPYSTLMKSIISNIFCGLVFMQVSTFAFFMLYSGWQYIFGEIVLGLCLIGSVWYKISIDLRFKRSLTELTRGDYENKRQLAINPAANDNGYEGTYPKQQKQKSADKPNVLDKMLQPFYCDLADLPVSYTKYWSLLRYDCQSEVLQNYDENYCLSNAEVHEAAKSYTHPSVGYCFGRGLDVFCD